MYDQVLFWVRALQVLLLLFVAHPTTTSVAMLGTPWLLYLTLWYAAALKHSEVAAATRMLLVLVGFGYFYARLQTDPVPRHYSQLISLVISIVESIGAGILWLVGDALGIPFIVMLMRLFSADEKVNADAVDDQLDNASEDFVATSALWWDNDPQLREWMGRR